jgi:hypothetical protein
MIIGGARMGLQLLVQDPYSLLYPLINRKIIDNDIFPPRLVMKCSKNIFELLAKEKGQSYQT